MHIIAGVW